MDVLLALIAWAVIALLYFQYQRCQRNGRPFFRVAFKPRKLIPIKVSSPQRSQQKYSQRSDNTAQSRCPKSGPRQGSARPSINVARRNFINADYTQARKPKKETVSAHLVKKLDSLTHDQNTSKRLIRNNKSKYPDRPLDWCAERAIWEMERDRR